MGRNAQTLVLCHKKPYLEKGKLFSFFPYGCLDLFPFRGSLCTLLLFDPHHLTLCNPCRKCGLHTAIQKTVKLLEGCVAE